MFQPPSDTIPEVRNSLNLAGRLISGIYLLQIGTVEKLRASMALPNEVSGSKVVIKFGLTKDFVRRFGEHERHFGELRGADFRVVKFVLADEDELEVAEAIFKAWFQVAAEPLRSTGPEMLRGGSKRQADYEEVVFLSATSLAKAVSFYEKQTEALRL
ncbi:hypothetical protein HDU88_005397 [Geranomyces variabilis]|nr:hypothetical protein HDU88_005397 [Geranomyces variabilis]